MLWSLIIANTDNEDIDDDIEPYEELAPQFRLSWESVWWAGWWRFQTPAEIVQGLGQGFNLSVIFSVLLAGDLNVFCVDIEYHV